MCQKRESQITERGVVTSTAGVLRNEGPNPRQGGGKESKQAKGAYSGEMDTLRSFSPDDEAQEKTRGWRLTS